jgi:ribosomal protein S18 acetylase RimI-like enzyme
MLQPNLPPETLVYTGDDAPETLHVGAFLDDALVGIASIYQSPPPDTSNAGAWRLRSMAVAPHLQRRGCGSALLRACLNHAAAQGGTMVWCYARSEAVSFYLAHGFQTVSEEFEIPDVGLHYTMHYAL